MIFKLAAIFIGLLVLAGVLVFALGAALPKAHVARVERVIAAPSDQIAARLRNVAAYSDWRDVTIADVRESTNAIAYVEISEGQTIAYRMSEPDRGRRFVSVITDETLPFGGQWTWTIEPQGGSTLVRIEEAGEIKSPVFRFFARYVFGYKTTMQRTLDALEKAAREA